MSVTCFYKRLVLLAIHVTFTACAIQSCHSASQKHAIATNGKSGLSNAQHRDDATCDALPAHDPSGYLVFCLCMGRYGNQMEQLLGVLAKGKALNRTIVLPPFISYERNATSDSPISLVRVEDVFQLEEIRKYYAKVLTMDAFMDHIAPRHWEESDRIAYCYRPPPRAGEEQRGCDAKRGSPFGPYWNYFGVDFTAEHRIVDYAEYSSLSLRPDEHPVIAISGAPSRFPMDAADRFIAKYFIWNDEIDRRASEFMERMGVGSNSAIVAAHIRAGSDWVKACEHAVGRESYMASPQCSGEVGAIGGIITKEICLPSTNMTRMAETLVHAGKKVAHALEKKEVLLFIASDVDGIGEELMKMHILKDTFARIISQQQDVASTPKGGVKEKIRHKWDPFLDLAVMSKADYLVGNCVSSFTSFVARMRDGEGKKSSTEFFGLGEAML